MLKSLLVVVAGVSLMQSGFGFTSEEARAIQKFWSQPGRYSVIDPDRIAERGEWQVRLTPEGSSWLWNYNKVRGLGKVNPSIDAGPQNEEQRVWEVWIAAKIAFDRSQAELEASKKNGVEVFVITPPTGPGPMPDGLRSLAGEAPSFAAAVRPRKHLINFPDGTTLGYEDFVAMRPRYAYFRFNDGVMSGGQSMSSLPSGELEKLYARAGIKGFAKNVFEAVSPLEGGFDSVNTYDTGFVSVGFLQFAALSEGGGSLGKVLLQMKQDDPRAFNVDFRRFGLDVSDDAKLIAFDLDEESEAVGPDANKVIIRDKRLIAVFQRAGRISDAFKAAQLKVAMDRYYPGNVALEVKWGGKTWRGKVCDVIKSEAGMATLMDRLVNTGNVGPLASVLAKVATVNNLESITDCCNYEYQVTRQLTYRKDYLAVAGLTKPRLITEAAARSGTRTGRGPKPKKP